MKILSIRSPPFLRTAAVGEEITDTIRHVGKRDTDKVIITDAVAIIKRIAKCALHTCVATRAIRASYHSIQCTVML